MDTVGVYFQRCDYASFWLRLLVDLIDAVTAGVLCCVAIVALWAFAPAKPKRFRILNRSSSWKPSPVKSAGRWTARG